MVYVDSIKVYPGSITLKAGSWYYKVRAEVCPTNADCTGVEWHSDDTSVATVNAVTGYIHARNVGTARIYAAATDGSNVRGYVTVTVESNVMVKSMRLNRRSVTLEKGACCTLTAMACPENATNQQISWRSSNTSVVAVSGGVVRAKERGSAYIYAEATDGSGVYARCYIYVTEDVLVTSVTVEPSNKTMAVGNSDYLHVTVCPKDAPGKDIKWSSTDPDVVSVDAERGLVYAKTAGTATIYAAVIDGSGCQGCCSVTVTGKGCDSETSTIDKDDSYDLYEMGHPENTYDY